MRRDSDGMIVKDAHQCRNLPWEIGQNIDVSILDELEPAYKLAHKKHIILTFKTIMIIFARTGCIGIMKSWNGLQGT